jgi:hypothetical protein
MINAILGTVENFIRAFPIEAVAVIAVLVGGGGLVLTGWRYLVNGILGLFAAFSAVLNALINFFRALLIAFGTTLGGLIILALGGMAIWWALILLSGG